MRTFSFTDVDRDLEGSFLEDAFLLDGDFDLFGDCDRSVAPGRFLPLDRDLNVDCVPAMGLRGAGRLAGDLDGGGFFGGERLRESERRGGEAFLGDLLS